MKKITTIFRLTGCFLAACMMNSPVWADIRLPALVGDSMVLQRDMPVKIWGWADPGEKIRALFKGKVYHATASARGDWFLMLAPSSAGGPFTLSLKGKNSVLLKDILVGDVWLCSGQSNMEYNVSEGITDQAEEIAAANFPQIRILKVEHRMSLLPEENAAAAGWQTISPFTVPHVSATAYFFGRALYRRYKVPVGLVTAAWGGTPIEAWLDAGSLKKVPAFSEEIGRQELIAHDTGAYRRMQAIRYAAWIREIDKIDSGMSDGTPRWAMPGNFAKGWAGITIPGVWEGQGFPGFDGIAWLRKEIELPASCTGKAGDISLGMVDDDDFTYLNGQLIGHTEGYDIARNYKLLPGLLRPGKNIISVRVYDHGGGGGLYGQASQFYLSWGEERITLSGSWQIRTSLTKSELPHYPGGEKRWFQLGGMYNGMIAPTENLAIKGIAWYQGESNVRQPDLYRQLFPLLIGSWRRARKDSLLPFLYVQLTNISNTTEYSIHDTAWAPLREAQRSALDLPATGMAVLIDDEGISLHPRHKQLAGERLALLARRIACGEDIVATGPLFQGQVIGGDSVTVRFFWTGSGLIIKNGVSLQGFEIAGEDGKFHPANAFLHENSVIVRTDSVKAPRWVRYDWANDPAGNLYNREGFPAAPFCSKIF